MGLFSFLFGGKYPQTKKYEAKIAKHFADFEHFNQVDASQKLVRYNELTAITADKDFKARVLKLRTEKFSSTKAFADFREYENLRKSSDIKGYYKFKEKNLDVRLEEAKKSVNYRTFLDLSEVIKTPEFRAAQAAKKFKKSEFYPTFKEYKRTAKSSERKFVDKTVNSAAYNNFRAVDGSERLKRFETLESYIKSNEFISFRCEMEDPKRYEKSQECALIKELEALQKDKELLWYFEQKKNDAFADIRKWDETFIEDFDSQADFEKRWMVGYYWGKVLMGDTYSLDGERQAFTKDNVNCFNSVATITTRPEKVQGKRWTLNNSLGFVTDEFDYTSAVINTGASHRQQYGRFDFKVKASNSQPITHNIWMVGEKMSPQINVAQFTNSRKGFSAGLLSNQNRNTVNITGANFSSDYYIISLMWSPDRLVWSVNGVEVHTLRGNVPQEPMYIVLSSNITSEGKVQDGQFCIDWVKCYTWHK